MNTLDDFARRTAEDILRRHAPDCLDRRPLIEAIVRLARLGIEGHLLLYRAAHGPDAQQHRPRR
jgi:hypothetical protein